MNKQASLTECNKLLELVGNATCIAYWLEIVHPGEPISGIAKNLMEQAKILEKILCRSRRLT